MVQLAPSRAIRGFSVLDFWKHTARKAEAKKKKLEGRCCSRKPEKSSPAKGNLPPAREKGKTGNGKGLAGNRHRWMAFQLSLPPKCSAVTRALHPPPSPAMLEILRDRWKFLGKTDGIWWLVHGEVSADRPLGPLRVSGLLGGALRSKVLGHTKCYPSKQKILPHELGTCCRYRSRVYH